MPSSKIATLAQAEAYLDGLINRERTPGRGPRMDLDPIARLLAAVGDPHAGLSVLHVAGSKGKGSTCLIAEAWLAAQGERVATFTSPHLSRWTERFRIDGREVEGARLAAAVERLRPEVDALKADPAVSSPSFFDVTTAAALLLFAEASVDRAILEVGLGGRLDSTNVVTPQATAITSIELEHTEFLGDTLVAIAGEKAGILKPGVPCVTGRLPGEAAEVVAKRAEELSAPLSRLGQEFDVEVLSRSAEGLALAYRDPDGQRFEFTLPLLGVHHADNAAIAICCASLLRGRTDRPHARFRVALPGRVERVETSPCVIVDAAHTEASARALVAAIEPIARTRSEWVLSISSNKNVDGLLRVLLPAADAVTVTRADPDRSLDPEALARAIHALDPHKTVRVVPDAREAVQAARARLAPDELLCVTGSVYLAGSAREALLREATSGE